jgi:glycosyltransferase involved in cell wall biosynthesis
MINMVSSEPPRSQMIGPRKLELNLRKGLDRIGYPYVLGRPLRSTKRLWIDGLPGLTPYLPRRDVYTVIGPNVWLVGWEVPSKARLDHAMLIHASDKVVAQFHGDETFRRCPVRTWPGGIDTDEFHPPVRRTRGRGVLVYSKQRDPREIPRVIETLLQHDLRPSLLLYGKYTEQEYREALAEAAFMVWHGRGESQGLALGEALSADVPVLVCNEWVEFDAARAARFHVPPGRRLLECAPYFDDRCGLRIDSLDKLSGAVEEMLDRLPEFRPRDYVLENLTLEKSARAFIDLWQEWGLSYEEGLAEVCRSTRSFRLPLRIVARQFGGATRQIIRRRSRPGRV